MNEQDHLIRTANTQLQRENQALSETVDKRDLEILDLKKRLQNSQVQVLQLTNELSKTRVQNNQLRSMLADS